MERFFDFLDVGRCGVSEREVRGGADEPVTAFPWTLSDDVKERLLPLLLAYGFDLEKRIQVREFVDRDGFLFFQ